MNGKKINLILILAILLFVLHGVDQLAAQGEISFRDAHRDFGVGQLPASAVVSDFNGDQIDDLAVTNAGSNSVSILLGQGDGTFGAAKNVATGSHVGSLVVGDFNGDARADLA